MVGLKSTITSLLLFNAREIRASSDHPTIATSSGTKLIRAERRAEHRAAGRSGPRTTEKDDPISARARGGRAGTLSASGSLGLFGALLRESSRTWSPGRTEARTRGGSRAGGEQEVMLVTQEWALETLLAR